MIFTLTPHYAKNIYFSSLKSFFVDDPEQIKEKAEEALKKYFGAKYVIFTPSGTAAIYFTLKGLNFENRRILLPFYIYETVPLAIRNSNNIPTFIDTKKDTFNIDENLIAHFVQDSSDIILTNHQFGIPCEIQKIIDIARNKGNFIIEDCAYSLGAEINLKKTGIFGDVGIISFDNKMIDGLGGGAICTNNQEIYQKIKQFVDNNCILSRKNFFSKLTKAFVREHFPYFNDWILKHKKQKDFQIQKQISSITPYFVYSALNQIEQTVFTRKKNAEFYNCYFNDIKGVIIPKISENTEACYNYFPIIFDQNIIKKSRDEIKKDLEHKGIYPIIASTLPKNLIGDNKDLYYTNQIITNSLCFPTGLHINQEIVQYISETLKQILK